MSAFILYKSNIIPKPYRLTEENHYEFLSGKIINKKLKHFKY